MVNKLKSGFTPYFILLVNLTVGCFFISGCQSESEALNKPLVWGGPKNIAMLPIIAEHKGFFKEAGLNTTPHYVQTGKIAMDATVSGDLDIGIIVDTNIAFVEFQQGANIQVIGSILEKFDDAIIARRDMGINKPKDLEGKTIAILNGTTSHRFADLFIDHHKLDRDSITFLNLSPPGIQVAVMNNNTEAGSIWQPFRYNIQKEIGDKAIQFKNDNIYRAYSLLAVRQEFASKHPDKINKFLKALIKAEAYAKDNKDEVIQILSKELNISAEVLAAVWGEYILRVQLDDKLLKVFQDEGAWIQRTQKGFEKKSIPTYENIINPTFLLNVDSSRTVVAK